MGDLWMFVGALVVVYLIPGPDMVLILQTSAVQGRKHGFSVAAGLALARAARAHGKSRPRCFAQPPRMHLKCFAWWALLTLSGLESKFFARHRFWQIALRMIAAAPKVIGFLRCAKA